MLLKKAAPLDCGQDIMGPVKVDFLNTIIFLQGSAAIFLGYGLFQRVTIGLNVLAGVLAILLDRLVAKGTVVGYYRRVWV